jgi:hypothetical protein
MDMSDPRKEHQSGTDETAAPQQGGGREQSTDRQQSGGTAGTNRDFDESGESRNQGHGHPREERSTGDRNS